MIDDGGRWLPRYPDFDAERLADPDEAVVALAILREAIAKHKALGDSSPEPAPSEGDVLLAAWAYIETVEFNEGAPHLAEMRKSWEKIAATAGTLGDELRNADSLTIGKHRKQFRPAPAASPEHSAFLLIGEYSSMASILHKIADAAQKALKEAPKKQDGTSNMTGQYPKSELVGACAEVFETWCPSQIKSTDGGLFRAFVSSVHQIATGIEDDCSGVVMRLAARVNKIRKKLPPDYEVQAAIRAMKGEVFPLLTTETGEVPDLPETILPNDPAIDSEK